MTEVTSTDEKILEEKPADCQLVGVVCGPDRTAVYSIKPALGHGYREFG